MLYFESSYSTPLDRRSARNGPAGEGQQDAGAGAYPGRVTFTRISVDPTVMGGAPCIRGMRVPVATVVAMVADGMSVEQILDDLPYLEADDVAESLRYAAEAVRERELPLTRPA